MADEPMLHGRDENTPVRALNRVFLVVAAVVVVVGAVCYGLWTALN
jgi:hypothetical protein